MSRSPILALDDAKSHDQGTEKFGLNVDSKNNIIYREWAPNAIEAYVVGEFSKTHRSKVLIIWADPILDNWDRNSHPMTKGPFGVFEITLPAQDGQPAIPHNSKLKVCILLPQRFVN